ncbi:SGNH/GDSL hydrolase family protein [Actinocatenispora rupis]|uniref:Lipase n=1 Tax=Actinocatenispora rupis TaxID=519421 RepID=A0A8J3J3I7_9ACTN|nr:SGNH/GDSL hydrolase family protein [Actinocatenispora rupis]GID15161.1 lipase [Actinocatenispora rupis]
MRVLPRIRRILVAGTVAAALTVASPLAAHAGTTTRALPAHPRYVALGDSYTSGPLIPLPRLDPVGCWRSTGNYPARVAYALRAASYTDVSCGGADTTDMTASQSVPLGSNPPQFDALRPDTELVTIGIGGNDFGVFGSVISDCPPLRAGDPTGNPCQRHFTVDGVDTLRQKIDQTRVRVADVVRGVHQRSPQARVLVVGYPRIAPESGTCPAVLPFADGDYPWLNGIEEYLNGALASASADAGADFVDTFPASYGHDACAGTAAWINGQSLSPTAAPYHPNAAGMAGVAAVVVARAGA